MLYEYLNIYCPKDDVGEYSQWKSFVSFTKLPRLQSEQKKKQHLAVANQLIRHANVKAAANIKVKATAKYKVPVSKEVEIINKWRELDQADRELAKTRAHYEVVQILQGCSKTSRKWSGFPTSVSMSDGLMFKGLNVLLA